ncbi:MAG: HEPN domain-containing protein [Pedobacter sp.]|nr:MAG: HEPN domain-containing protein [Pedobacter sp.]
MISAQDWEVAINRSYYAAFHAVSALLFKNDIKVKAHSGAKAMLELHFVKTSLLSVEWGRFYAQLFNERNDSDYEDFAIFTAEDVLPLLPQTEEFIDVIKRLINH